MEFTRSEVEIYYSQRLPRLKQRGREWRGACPVHGGKDDNFAVQAETGAWFCHSACNRGGDVISLEMELQSVDFVKAKATVFDLIGRPKPNWEDRDIEATYDYTDAAGNLLYQVVRKTGKKFSQRRPGENGRWIWGLGKVSPVPFQLPIIADAELIAICEGEKDCLRLRRAGIVATCNNGGAGNFRPELALYFAGKRVAIFPDNDEPGRKHAKAVAAILAPVARSIRIVEIPGLPLKGDVSDFLMSSGTIERLLELYEAADDWSEEWDYRTEVPHENDKYVRTFSQFVTDIGGLQEFWNLPVMEGAPTPFSRLNERLGGGLRPGEVYVIGANQGQGKTSLGLRFIVHALRNRRCALLFSMEMGHRDVFQRMVGMEAHVDLNEFRQMQRAAVNTDAYSAYRMRLQRQTQELASLPLFVSTRPRVTPEFLMEESVRLSKRHRIDLVIVDHMQLMSTTGTARGDYEKFTAISRANKEVAMELKLPVLLISQTSRNNAHDKRTELEVSDLRGSGAIEEDAAAVMLLYDDKADRDRHLAAQTYDVGPVKTWLKLGKNRFGPAGSGLPLLHFKKTTRFEPMSAEREA